MQFLFHSHFIWLLMSGFLLTWISKKWVDQANLPWPNMDIKIKVSRKPTFHCIVWKEEWKQDVLKFKLIINPNLVTHSYPKWEYKIKNVSEVWYIFLKSKFYDNSKNYFLKILGLAPCPLTPISFDRSILEKNVRK